MSQLPPAAHEVLSFWFFDLEPRDWFGGGEAVDARIAARFSELLSEARAGHHDDWADSPRGLLALVIVLDQFSRNIHRAGSGAFAADAKALGLTKRALKRGDEDRLSLDQRQFLLMPLMHSEDAADQEESVRRFAKLGKDADVSLDFAHQHEAVIARFGRFPHRNAALGRASTPEETAWLAEHGNPFG